MCPPRDAWRRRNAHQQWILACPPPPPLLPSLCLQGGQSWEGIGTKSYICSLLVTPPAALRLLKVCLRKEASQRLQADGPLIDDLSLQSCYFNQKWLQPFRFRIPESLKKEPRALASVDAVSPVRKVLPLDGPTHAEFATASSPSSCLKWSNFIPWFSFLLYIHR